MTNPPLNDGSEPSPRRRLPMTPALISGKMQDNILSRWRRPHVTTDAGQLCGSWIGGPASPPEKAEWLIQIACEALEELHPTGAWQCFLDTDPLYDQPSFILATDRRQTVEIPFQMSGRALRIAGQAIPLEAPDAGRRILEATCDALGARFGVPPSDQRRVGRRHDA